MPVTRSTAASSRLSLEKIIRTNDPIQVTFETEGWKIPLWRRALHKFYAEEPMPPGITFSWRDRNKEHQALKTSAPINPPYPNELYETIIQLLHGTQKLITVTLFYTTGTGLAQGNCCQTWVDDEFVALRDSVAKMATALISQPLQASPSSSLVADPVSVQCTSSDDVSDATANCGHLPATPSSSPGVSDQPAMDKSQLTYDSTLAGRPAGESNPLTPPSGTAPSSSPRDPPPGNTLHQPDAVTPCSDVSSPLGADPLPPGNTLDQPDEVTPRTDVSSPLGADLIIPPPTELSALCHKPVLEWMLMMQTTVRTLQAELHLTRRELSEVKARCASLSDNQAQLDSLARDSDVKLKNCSRATDKFVIEAINSSLEPVTKTQQAHTDRLNQLTSFKDSHASKLHDMKRQLKALSVAAESNKSKTSISATPSTSESLSLKSTPPNSPKSNDSTTQHTPHPDVTIENMFAALSNGDGEEQAPDAGTDDSATLNAGINPRVATTSESLVTPLDNLRAQDVRHDVNTVLIGDSVLKTVDARRMSVDGAVVQNLSVSGLTVNELAEWLRNQRSARHIRRVVFHVGINSCRQQGPVKKRTWIHLIRTLNTAFPNANIQASAIMPPRGHNHPLYTPASISNDALKDACQQMKILFTDHTFTFLTANRAPRKKLYQDGIHPSPAGAMKLALNIRFAGVPRGQPHNGHRVEENRRISSQPLHTYHQQQQSYRPFSAVKHQHQGMRRGNETLQNHYQAQRDQTQAYNTRPPGHAFPTPTVQQGQRVPIVTSQEEFPDIPAAMGYVPADHPFTAPATGTGNLRRGWEQSPPTETSPPNPLQTMQLMAQLLLPYLPARG